MSELRTFDDLNRRLDGMSGLTYTVEHNTFELERLSPMARSLASGVKVVREWPWSTVLDWR